MRASARSAARRAWRRRPAAAALLLVLVAAACGDRGGAPDRPSGDREFRLAYDQHGTLDPTKQEELGRLLAAAAGATDVVVFSHGWWNTPETAECRYREMIEGLRARRPAALGEAFRPVLVGIYWPSALFPPEPGDCAPPESVRETAGPTPSGPALRDRLRAWASVAFPDAAGRPGFPAEVERLAALLEREQAGPLSPGEGEALVAILLAWKGAGERPDLPKPADAPGEASFDLPAGIAAERWRRPPARRPGGEASGSPEAFAGTTWLQWANVFTFWTMKDRAGVVGSRGVYELLAALQPARARGVRVHLVAHSFGGKLLAAALTGHGRGPANRVDSFVILQGAFSHFAFSTAGEIRALQVATDQPGLYAGVIAGDQVAGPLVTTYSLLDIPNRVFYGLGVRVSGDMLEAEVVERYGALGANGMQGPPVERLQLGRDRLGERYRPGGKRLFNIDGSGVILSHTDFVKPAVLDLIWDAIDAGRRTPRG